jgi:predicted dienelactone hydrolase
MPADVEAPGTPLAGVREAWRILAVYTSRLEARHVIRLLAVLAPVTFAVPALAIDAPDALGPWKVGHRETSVVSPPHLPSGATQFFDIWYPVDNGDWVGAFTTYFLSELLFATVEIDSTVAKRDVPVSSTGGRGLIVFSHGSGSVAVQSVVLVETLASHGFIVVAPTHYFNNSFDTQLGNSQPFLVTARQRPKEGSFSIDYMFGRNQDNLDDFFGSIDETKVGVTGHSFGGFTADAMASGYTGGFCDTETDSDYGDACTTGAECISTCSVETVPADARVKVIMPVSPAHALLSDTELQSVGVPTLCMAGSIEALSTQCQRPFPLTQASASPNFRVDVIGAAHEAFANTCDFGDALIDVGICPNLSDPLPNPPCDIVTADPADYTAWASLPGASALIQPYINVCVVPQVPLAEVNRLQSLYTVSMFRRHLLGEVEYDAFLTVAHAASEPYAVFFPDAFSVPALTAAGLVLLGGLLAGTAARWTRRRSGVG